MARVLIIPAAGAGSRLQAAGPKALVRIGGVTMLDRLLALYAGVVDRVAVVVHPSFFAAAAGERFPAHVEFAVQEQATGMLDAILLAGAVVRPAAVSSVWITWCDQVGVDPRTVARLRQETAAHPDAAVVMPTVTCAGPYIHLERDAEGRIARVLQKREGDAMPEMGESDMGLFALSIDAYRDLLPQYAADADVGGTTGERNFLPFVPWVASRGEVITFPCTDPREAIGVNTREDLARVEAYLDSRNPSNLRTSKGQ